MILVWFALITNIHHKLNKNTNKNSLKNYMHIKKKEYIYNNKKKIFRKKFLLKIFLSHLFTL